MNPLTEGKIAAYMRELAPACAAFSGRTIDRNVRAELARLLFSVMPPYDKATPGMTASVMQSLSPLDGSTLNTSMVKRNLHRIVANWHFIRDELEIPMWEGVLTPSAVTVLGLAKVMTDGSKIVALLKLKTGLCAGIIQCALFWRNKISTFLQHNAGVSKFECAPEEFSGMAFHAMVEMSGDRLTVKDMHCTEADKKGNQLLMKARRDAAKCGTPVPCNTCNMDIKTCPLAIWLPEDKGESNG